MLNGLINRAEVAGMDAPKTLAWSSDEIARFWDYWSGRDDSQETYFALQVGDGVARFVQSSDDFKPDLVPTDG